MVNRRMRGNSRRRFHLGAERLERRLLLTADVMISEFVSANEAGILDEDGDAADWIEIYNAGPDPVNLAGWHLTDDRDTLRKWSFPAEELPAGTFLLVFASDKNRSIAGAPLHTNFKIKSEGEYLALTRDDPSPSNVEIVSAFSPEYPRQFRDISYGITQEAQTTELVTVSNSARVLFPGNDSLGQTWTNPRFNDFDWSIATSAVGYQRKVPGFYVQDAKSRTTLLNLSEASAVLAGEDAVSHVTSIVPTVNFLDFEGGGSGGNFTEDLDFPNNSPADDNDFAVRATGTITIPRSGPWTFGIHSDEGARLRIGDRTIIEDDTLHLPESSLGRDIFEAGEYDIELIYFERGAGAEVELFAAEGFHFAFHNDFRLIGDVEHGGLRVATSEYGDPTLLGSLIKTDVETAMAGRTAGVYVRIPFVVSNPRALDSLKLRVHYDAGFIAYLNGQEVARRNAPPTARHDALATVERGQPEIAVAELIDLAPYQLLLKQGANNVLAMHGLNDAIDSTKFLLRAELVDIKVTNGPLRYFQQPTPGSFNPSSGVDGFLTDEILLSHQHGFYEQPFSLALSARTQGTTIKYTLDGSEPTDTHGIVYRAPIRVAGTTTMRARAFQSGRNPSFVETATYIFLDDVLKQSPTGTPPSGFPAGRNINGQLLDYGMDPEIVNDPHWGPRLKDALTQIPSLSIVMDVDDLFGAARGIYTNARSHGKAWERPASLELIQPDGSEGFQVATGIRIRGGFSRSGKNPKHAFRLFFREEYGDAKLEFPLFGAEGTNEFDKLDLRTTQNYSWSFQGSSDNAFVRDVFARDLQRELGQPYTRSRYYHLYINGQYWGLFQTQERAEARFAVAYFGGDVADYDVIKSAGNSGAYENEATDGDLDAYRRLADYFYQPGGLGDRNAQDYYQAQGMNPDGTRNPDYERLLDVDNLIDYLIITYYTGDRDGPVSRFVNGVNNYFAIFNRKRPDGFKFFEHDSEHTLDRGFPDLAEQLTSNGSAFRFFNPLWMHEQLVSGNSDYRLRFADAVVDYFRPDGVLSDSNTTRLLDQRAAEIQQAVIAESARWGDAKQSVPLTQDDWAGAVNRARSFLSNRSAMLIEQFRRLRWLPTVDPPEFLVRGQPQHGGELSVDDEIALRSPASSNSPRPVIYYTLDGSDPRLPGGAVSPTAKQFTRPFSIPRDTRIRARMREGNAWSAAADTRFVVTDPALAANDDVIKVDEAALVTMLANGTDNVLANDIGLQNAPVNVFVQQLPRHSASFTLNRDGTFRYLHNGDEELSDAFSYRVTDANGKSASATVMIVVRRVSDATPNAIDDEVQVAEGGLATALVGGRASVLSNDLGLLDAPVVATLVRAPAHAANFTFNADGTFQYRHDGSENFLDAFTYSIEDNDEQADFAQVLISVTRISDSLPRAVPDRIELDEGATTTSLAGGETSVLANDTGLRDEPIYVRVVRAPLFAAEFVMHGDGTFLYTHDNSENLKDSFSYEIKDNDGEVSTSEVDIVIRPVDEATPMAVDDVITLAEGGTVTTLVTGATSVLANDEGLVDLPIEVRLLRGPEFSRRFTLNPDGTFRYTHNGGEFFTDSFTYEIKDGDGDVGAAEVLISITPVSDTTPRAVNDEIRVRQGHTATTLKSGASSVLANDRGLDDTPPLVTLVSGPLLGTRFKLDTDGSFSYEHDGSRGTVDSFVYQVRDNDGQTSTAKVSIVIELEPVAGDFNGDEAVDEQDIDVLAGAISAGKFVAQYDLNDDRRLTAEDLTELVERVLGTRRGDIDLDGDVDFADFLTMSASFGRSPATWRHGDFDGDERVAFADFLALSANFGFEREPPLELVDAFFAAM